MTIDPESTETQFLPGPRDTGAALAAQVALLESAVELRLLRDLPLAALALNDKRQIVWMNARAAVIIGPVDGLGMRPGEALRCSHASSAPAGCGTTSFCAFCGAASAIMQALSGTEASEECVIQRGSEALFEALNLLVWSKPFAAGGGNFVLFTIRDVSAEKRHEFLERLFYHDIGNTVAGIRAMVSLMETDGDGGESACPDCMELLDSATEQLVEEIDSQRSLKAAEAGTLMPDMVPVELGALAMKTAALLKYTLYSRDVRLETVPAGRPVTVVSDPVLLRRVVGNMLKNAVEASSRGETVRLGVEERDGRGVVWVWNPAVMADEARHRIFQRSYSTKGRGRGLGSYSMKVLAERYLGGSVGFRSGEGEGTVFEVSLPGTGECAGG